ncbi:discoidin domain-containing protein [Saccharothrix texasensis]|uniref:F5/8 type C domain-containing protein n=1 Tax=Saccharothrix texasensis TaxID=103734 RepID=A0A3N1GXB7_9PSEU|nr:discoidin domain-containing protein [Saccharothrix texasensis]ROP34973.1 F5/8 type C domain-containing protein [Saccharothrix texasensis]
MRTLLSIVITFCSALALAVPATAGTPAAGAPTAGTPTVATAPSAQAVPSDVHLFYYPWYGSPDLYGSYRHWQQGGHTPPDDIGADFFPTLGAYDSGDLTRVVDQHMQWVRRSGAGVIVTSWWGQGSYEDRLVPGLLDAAARHGVRVAFHLEPYGGRTAQSTVADVRYLDDRYGSSPAFYRDAQRGNRGAFYVFNSLDVADWTPLDAVRDTGIVLAQTTDMSKVAHFGGIYTYDVIASSAAIGWKGVADHARANGLVWAPSVGPGYLDDRAVPGNTSPTLDRADGATYDLQWRNALSPETGGKPDWVSITSFNEWHEGSTIEPADSTPPAGHGYLTYEGAYGRTGQAAETAYLDRTRYWVEQFTGSAPPVPNPDLAGGRVFTARSNVPGHAGPNANDGDAGTYWESAHNLFPQPLTVDLGATEEVGRVEVAVPPGWEPRTQRITVRGSADGRTWTTLVANRGHRFDPATGNRVSITVPQAFQRHLRLVFTANTRWPAGQAAEVGVFRF